MFTRSFASLQLRDDIPSSSTSSDTTTTSSTSILSNGDDGPNTGSILGYLVAGVAVVSIIIIISFFAYLHVQRRRQNKNSSWFSHGYTLDANGVPSRTQATSSMSSSTLPSIPIIVANGSIGQAAAAAVPGRQRLTGSEEHHDIESSHPDHPTLPVYSIASNSSNAHIGVRELMSIRNSGLGVHHITSQTDIIGSSALSSRSSNLSVDTLESESKYNYDYESAIDEENSKPPPYVR